jgi:hypothetical protein
MRQTHIWENPKEYRVQEIFENFRSLSFPELTQILKEFVESNENHPKKCDQIYIYINIVNDNPGQFHTCREKWKRLHYFVVSIQGPGFTKYLWIRREPEVFLHYVTTLSHNSRQWRASCQSLMNLILATESQGGSDWARRADHFLRTNYYESEWKEKFNCEIEKRPRILNIYEVAREYRNVK